MSNNRWLTDIFRFAVGTGLRRKALRFLEWRAIDLERRTVSVIHTERFKPKGGRERTIPLIGRALQVARRRHEERASDDPRAFVFRGAKGGQFNADHVSRRFKTYRERAELPEVINFHSLRHTFASWWVQRGGDLYRLKKVMGHKRIETTMQCAHLRQESLRKEMERLFGNGREDDQTEEG